MKRYSRVRVTFPVAAYAGHWSISNLARRLCYTNPSTQNIYTTRIGRNFSDMLQDSDVYHLTARSGLCCHSI
jgi:hypothetical protein